MPVSTRIPCSAPLPSWSAGLIYTQRTAGKFVTEDAAAVAAARRSLAEAQTRQYLAAMRALGCGKQEIHNLFDQMEEQEHADL